MLRTFLGTLSIAALTAMPALAEQHIDEDAVALDAESLDEEVEAALIEFGFAAAATATVVNRDFEEIGTVTINRTLSGTPLIIVALTAVPPGTHAIHLHENGDCSEEDFSSAGGHISGDAEHGIYVLNGPHPGDLPNAIVGEDGDLNVEYFQPGLDIDEQISDFDGSSFVMHAGADDYRTQPAGDSGARIACGVFEDA